MDEERGGEKGRRQKDATNINKRLRGRMGKLQLEDVLLKVGQVDW